MNQITVETTTIADVPIIIVAPEDAEGCPIVFHVHGFTGNKKAGVALGYRLAMEGMVCVCVDAYMHGDRLDPRLTALLDGSADYVYPRDTGLDIYFELHNIVKQTGDDVERLIDRFAGDPRVDTGRVGVTGYSMGGFTTYYTAAHNPRVQAAAALISFPALTERWEDVIAESSSYEKWADAIASVEAETAERTAFIRAMDPYAKLRDFYPRPLLMIQGDLDTDAPKFYTVKLYRELKPIYAEHPERLALHVYDHIAHQVTNPMRDDVSEWFKQHLLGKA